MARDRDRWHTALLRNRLLFVEVEDHNGHLGTLLVVVGNRLPEVDHRVEDRSGRRVGRRNSRGVEVCDGDSHRGVGYSREVDLGDRSSNHRLVVDRSRHGLLLGSLGSGIGIARVVVGYRFAAVWNESVALSHI